MDIYAQSGSDQLLVTIAPLNLVQDLSAEP